MGEISKCPKCGGELQYINETMADYDCIDCGQRMDKRDYIQWPLKNFWGRIDQGMIFDTVFEGVNNG